ncbi:MAG: hypothetical protein GY740_22070 [Gammaproteobacteria bacterium]|nr:hypothetical protein [Gammaproteobacteria bacterium]
MYDDPQLESEIDQLTAFCELILRDDVDGGGGDNNDAIQNVSDDDGEDYPTVAQIRSYGPPEQYYRSVIEYKAEEIVAAPPVDETETTVDASGYYENKEMPKRVCPWTFPSIML